jgi:hypothetical protein
MRAHDAFCFDKALPACCFKNIREYISEGPAWCLNTVKFSEITFSWL